MKAPCHLPLSFRSGPFAGRRQRGAVLIVSLVVLVVLTLLGLNSMQTATLEERMSGYQRDRGIAFSAAELALSEGLSWLESREKQANIPLPKGDCGETACDIYELDQRYFRAESDSWWSAHAKKYQGPMGQADIAPRYLIEFGTPMKVREHLNAVGTAGQEMTVDYYRITSRGQGQAQESQGQGSRRISEVLLQATYAVPQYVMKTGG